MGRGDGGGGGERRGRRRKGRAGMEKLLCLTLHSGSSKRSPCLLRIYIIHTTPILRHPPPPPPRDFAQG